VIQLVQSAVNPPFVQTEEARPPCSTRENLLRYKGYTAKLHLLYAYSNPGTFSNSSVVLTSNTLLTPLSFLITSLAPAYSIFISLGPSGL